MSNDLGSKANTLKKSVHVQIFSKYSYAIYCSCVMLITVNNYDITDEQLVVCYSLYFMCTQL